MQAGNKKRRFNAVIFDLDGTLADTLPTVMRIFNRLMADKTGREWRLEELIPYFGPPETVIFNNLFPHEPDPESIAAEFYRLCREDGREIKPFEGMREIIDELHTAGVKLGVYSGASTQAARIRAEHAGLLSYFKEIIGGDRVDKYKPHPEGLLKLMEYFEVEPQSTAYVGDMVADVEAGRGAGATTIAVTWGAGTRDELLNAGPDFLVDHPSNLRQIFR
jgi:phosphoglycolate phosphatase/pyrophosphatase PpaX